MKKFVVLFLITMILFTASCALADEAWIEDEFIIVTTDGTFVCYEDEFVWTILCGEADVFNAYFVDAEELIPCEVIETEDGIYIRLFSFEDYNVTEEMWRCTWC